MNIYRTLAGFHQGLAAALISDSLSSFPWEQMRRQWETCGSSCNPIMAYHRLQRFDLMNPELKIWFFFAHHFYCWFDPFTTEKIKIVSDLMCFRVRSESIEETLLVLVHLLGRAVVCSVSAYSPLAVLQCTGPVLINHWKSLNSLHYKPLSHSVNTTVL